MAYGFARRYGYRRPMRRAYVRRSYSSRRPAYRKYRKALRPCRKRAVGYKLVPDTTNIQRLVKVPIRGRVMAIGDGKVRTFSTKNSAAVVRYVAEHPQVAVIGSDGVIAPEYTAMAQTLAQRGM